MKKIDKDKINKILVVRTDRMGEVLLNIPAIRALKQSFKAFIVVLVNSSAGELLKGVPEIDQILIFDEDEWKKNIFGKLSLLYKLRKIKFALAVILNPTKRFHILTYLAGIPRRLGYDRKCAVLLTDKIKDRKFQGQKHEVEYNLDLVRYIGADTEDLHISLKVGKKDIRFVKEFLLNFGVQDKDLKVALHPFSSNPAKCWPKENFAQVADELIARFSAKVIIIGGAQEANYSAELVSRINLPVIDLSGKLTLKQLAAFLQICRLLITNDSGPMHIAAAVGTPTVVIFGRNIPGVGPQRWAPWGNRHTLLHKDTDCNPCGDRNCPYDFKCLTSVTVAEVLAATKRQLAHANIDS